MMTLKSPPCCIPANLRIEGGQKKKTHHFPTLKPNHVCSPAIICKWEFCGYGMHPGFVDGFNEPTKKVSLRHKLLSLLWIFCGPEAGM